MHPSNTQFFGPTPHGSSIGSTMFARLMQHSLGPPNQPLKTASRQAGHFSTIYAHHQWTDQRTDRMNIEINLYQQAAYVTFYRAMQPNNNSNYILLLLLLLLQILLQAFFGTMVNATDFPGRQ